MGNIIGKGATGTAPDVPTETRSPQYNRSVALAVATAVRGTRSKYRTFAPVPIMAVPTKLVVQHTIRTGTGITPVFTPINVQGDTFVNAANATLQILNSSGKTVTVTVIGEQVCNQGYLHNYSIGVPSGSGLPVEMGPFDFHYNDPQAVVHITYSFNGGIVPGVTIAVVAP